MILNRIQIEGYKALRNPVELKGLGVGIHLIHGPNETGKSTLISAVARALFDRYNTQDQEIRGLRPWGTELAPRVTLEFETGGRRFKLDKKFLDEEGSSLSEWNGAKFERVADSVKADDRVRAFLLGTASKSGAATLGNWGLARLLWMTQLPSRLKVPELDESLRQHLMGILGSAVLSEKEQRLLAQLDKAYEVFYTAAKQSEKKGSPLFEARERSTKAEETLAYWKGKWDEMSRLNELALGSQDRLAKISEERGKLEAQIAALKTRAQDEFKLENLLKVKEQELLVIQGRWKSLAASSAEISTLEQGVQVHHQSLATVEPLMRADEAALTGCELKLKEAQAQVQATSERASSLSRQLGQAALASNARNRWNQIRELEALYQQAVGLENRRDALRSEYAAIKRPKTTDLEEARALHAEARSLRNRILQLGIEVRVLTQDTALELQWVSADGAVSKSRGAELVFHTQDQGELLIPGFGRIQIRSGAEGAQALETRLTETEAKLARKLECFGAVDFEELQKMRTTAQELESVGSTLTAEVNAALGGRYKAVSELSAELAKHRAQLRPQLDQAGLSEGAIPEESGDLRELQTNSEAALQSRELAIANQVGAEGALSLLLKRLDDARRLFETAQQGISLLGAQIQAKLAMLGGREALARATHEAVHLKNELEAEREILTSKLPPAEQRASITLGALERTREEAGRSELLAQREFDQADARLVHAQGEGYYSKLAAAEEESALALELLARRQAQAQGTKVLRALAHTKRDRLNSGLLAPVEARVVSLFNHLRGEGTSLSQLAFGGQLHEIGVRIGESGSLEGRGDLGLDSLSLGTQEQVMLALRLAFGQLLSERGEKPEPQLVVLDDPLVNADAARQRRALELLLKASSQLQILILTARPEDYRILNPKEYDLAALKA